MEKMEFAWENAAGKGATEPEWDSDSSSGKVHGHYRRKKTNKAPRKRTFIANMTKYNNIETSCLASAARGVGTTASGGAAQGSAALAGGLPNFFGPPSAEEEAGNLDWLASFPPLPADMAAADVGAPFGTDPVSSGLPWELAAMPNVGAPVIWGTKQVQATASARAPAPLPSSANGFSFCSLLTDVVDTPDLDAAGAASHSHQQHSRAAAAAAAAASVAAYAPAPSIPVPTGPPKVSFDMFPELAALAAGGFEPAAAVSARPLCFSRAVVTSVEERATGFMPAAPAPPAGPSRQASLVSASSLAATNAAAGLEAAHSLGAANPAAGPGSAAAVQAVQQQQATNASAQMNGTANGNGNGVMMIKQSASMDLAPMRTSSSGRSSDGKHASGEEGNMMMMGALVPGSWPTSNGHMSSGSAASTQSMHAGLMAQMQAAQQQQQAALNPSSAVSEGSRPTQVTSHAFAALMAQQLQQQQAALMNAAAVGGALCSNSSLNSAMSAAASMQFAQLAAAQQQVAAQLVQAAAVATARGGRRGGARRGAGPASARGSNGRGRALARSASGVALASMGSGSMGAAQQGAAGAAPALGPHGERTAPFTVQLHGVSPAGAVVPGSAGELSVTRLISVGAYGVVYKARWGGSAAAGGGSTGADVAVKLMRRPQPGDGLSEGDVLRSFRHEASLLRRLAHPNIVALRHAQDVEPVCIVQDLAAHGTLAEYIHAPAQLSTSPYGPSPMSTISDLERAVLRRLARRCALHPDTLVADLEARSVASVVMGAPTPSADGSVPHANQRLVRRYVVLLCLLRDVAAALTHLTGPLPGAAGGCLVHRDIKPSNILLSGAGSALLADFGVAKVLPLPGSVPVGNNTPGSPSAATATGAPTNTQWNGLLPAASMPAPATHVPSKRALPSSGSAPAPLASSAVVAAFSEWSGAAEEAAPAPAARGAKRTKVDTGVWSSVPDALPSWDADMAWLADLLAEDEAPVAPAAAAPAGPSSAQAAAAAAAAAAAIAVAPASPSHSSGGSAGSGSPVGSAADTWPQHHGTAHYAAPEDLARGASPFALGPAADVFSLGYCIWEALTGQRPWSGSRAAAVADAVGRGNARLPLPACWPARLRDLVARCWSADPAQRPTPAEVGGVLEEEVRRVLARA